MKKITIAFILLITTSVEAQQLKINFGIATSSLKIKPFNSFNDPVLTFTGGVGATYLEHKAWDLTSSVNYLSKGGSANATFLNDQGEVISNKKEKAMFNYLSLANSVRLKISSSGILTPYFNIGAYGSYLMNTNSLVEKNVENSINIGGIVGAGVFRRLLRTEYGIQGNWLPSFNKLRKNGSNTISDNTFSISFTVGIF